MERPSVKMVALLLFAFWLGTLVSFTSTETRSPPPPQTIAIAPPLPQKKTPEIASENASHSSLKRWPHDQKFSGPSVCVVGRSSRDHIPDGLMAFVGSLFQTKYPAIYQFIIGCEFTDDEEHQLRDTVSRLNSLLHQSTRIFVVNRNDTIRKEILRYGLNDYCYIETDLTIDRLLDVKTSVLTRGTSFWPVLSENELPRRADTRLCDFFLFSNTDNVYGKHMFTYLKPLMDKGHKLIGMDFVSHHPKTRDQTRGGREGKFVHAHAGFVEAGIDLGAALISADLFKVSSDLRFVIPRFQRWEVEEKEKRLPSKTDMQRAIHDADGILLQQLAALGPVAKPIVEHKVFFLHQ